MGAIVALFGGCALFSDITLFGGLAMGLVFFWLLQSIALEKVTRGWWSRKILKVARYGVGIDFFC